MGRVEDALGAALGAEVRVRRHGAGYRIVHQTAVSQWRCVSSSPRTTRWYCAAMARVTGLLPYSRASTCEIGATKMSDALGDVRDFLADNPGEVVVLFLEPYVPPDEIASQSEHLRREVNDLIVTVKAA